MSDSQQSFAVKDIVGIVRTYPRRCLAPAALVALVCATYAVCKPSLWEASQAVVVRNEAASAETAPGRFRDIDEMKVSQETILEVVKSHRVLSDALIEVGSARSWGSAPSPEAVDDLRDNVMFSSPPGVEFGKTEISYLTVRDRDRQRVVALAAAVAKHLDLALRRLRDTKAQSMVEELTKTVAVADNELADAARRLGAIERQLGADLSDLRNMELNATGDSDLRRRLNSVEDELRQVSAERQAAEVLRGLLASAQDDPKQVLATPKRLMQSQPALLRLKEGLVAAQLKVSQLLGHMSDAHPQVIAAREEEQQIAQRLHEEVSVALRGVEADVRLAEERQAWLESQRRDLQDRLQRLAEVRPQYSLVLQEVNQRNEAVANARRKLAAAQAAQIGAQSAGLLTFVESPVAGRDPVGPSRISIVLLGIVAGLVTGASVLFLTVPVKRPPAIHAEEAFAASQRGWGLATLAPTTRPAESVVIGA